jgi:hypothetical protein
MPRLRALMPATDVCMQADEGGSLFWQFVDLVMARSNDHEPSDPDLCWQHITSLSAELLSPAMAQVRGAQGWLAPWLWVVPLPSSLKVL